MLKRIIFDIDATLLDSDKDCYVAYEIYLKNNQQFKFTPKDIYDSIENYTSKKNDFNLEKMAESLSSYLNDDIKKEDIIDVQKTYERQATLINLNTSKVLDYLSKKYELFALSNWYSDIQATRLEEAGIKKYFMDIYGVDNLGIKPSIETFQKVCAPYSYEECLIIGDSITSDIEVPTKLGMRAIYFNVNNITSEYESINNLEELLIKL